MKPTANERLLSRLRRNHVRFLAPYERRFAVEYGRLMEELRDATKKRDPSFPLKTWTERVKREMRPLYEDAFLAAGRQLARDSLTLRRKGIYGCISKAAGRVSIEERLDDLLDRLGITIETTSEAFQDLLDEAEQDDLDDDEIEELIDEEWSDLFDTRIPGMAVSEMNGTANSARDYVMQTVVEFQRWITAGDERVRPTHVIYGDAGAKPVGYDWAQLLDTDAGYVIRYPADPLCNEPAEICNCRCFVLPDGDVTLNEDELADFLDDFDMDPEDLGLSDEQDGVFIPNPYH